MASTNNRLVNILDELSKLALKHRADKWSKRHNYTPVYHELFKDKRKSVKKVLEIGIGGGASLRMWQDFFPNAQIYGADYRNSALIRDKRIESILCDQRIKGHLVSLIDKIGSDIDMVVDDGSHRPRDQIFTCLTLMPLLKKSVTYVIEDVADPSITERLTQYDVAIPKIDQLLKNHYDNRLVVVKNKAQINTYEYILNKYNIDPSGQSFIEIPNVGRNNLAELFAELKFTEGAEIGVDAGEYSEILCKTNPKLHLYSIDPWDISAYGPDVIPSEIGITPNQAAFEAHHEKAKKRLAAYNCTVVQKYSLVAAQDFADNSLDFVYIDANHDFVNATNDLDTWKKKVKLGGILAGHEYENFPPKKWNHVKSVLQGYMPSYQMLPCFILGTTLGKEKGEIRDRIRSWFWVKK